MLNRERWSVFLLENFVFSSNVALHHLLYEVIMVIIWEVFPWDEGHWRGYVVTHTQPLVVQNIPKFGTMDRFSLKHFVYQTEKKQPKWKWLHTDLKIKPARSVYIWQSIHRNFHVYNILFRMHHLLRYAG